MNRTGLRLPLLLAGLLLAPFPVVLGPCAQAAAADDAARLLTPPPAEGPVVVWASFQLNDLNEIDDTAETFQFSGILRLRWHDPRQAFDPAEAGVAEKFYQGSYQFDELAPAWYPQILLANESGFFEVEAVLLRALPDGTQTLYASVDADAETDLALRRLPFDAQHLEAVFEVLGMDASEVRLEVAPDHHVGLPEDARVPQWTLERVFLHTGERMAPEIGPGRRVSQLLMGVDVQRRPFFILRLIVFPLALIVALSWVVFWMDRSSLGDRIAVSFVGILTAVAYQFVVADLMPKVAYVTLIEAFLNLSFLVMCATVVVNLVVGAYDQAGRSDAGDRIDHQCRWIFPLAYLGLVGVGTFAFVTFG